MATEQHAPKRDQAVGGIATVTTEEFASVVVEAPIRDSRNVDCWTLGALYGSASKQEADEGNDLAAHVFGLLSAIANIHFKPEDGSEPYGPQFVIDARRSIIPADLKGEQSIVLAELVPTIRNPGLRARLADITWFNDRSLAAMAKQAIGAYCEAVRLVLDGRAEFFNQDRTASGHEGCRMLRRACQIAHATGWKDPGASGLRILLAAVIGDAINRQDHQGFFNAADVALHFGLDDPATIASNAESFATSEDVDPHWSRDLWELAARAHSSLHNEQERDRSLVGAAESYVTLADAAGGEGMIAAGAIMNAIQALRRLPDTKQRRHELEGKLRHAQATVRDEMGVVSTTFDLTDYIQHARRSVGGITLAQAVGEFADLTPSPDPEELRDEARRVAEENPLSSIMPSTLVDEDGKVVAKSPGMLGDESDSDIALHHLIARHESLRRQTVVNGLIEPARQLIQSEHPLGQHHLRLIAAMTPFIPADRVALATMGLARFFGGDFFSALHILVPQLEHSLRHILKHAGVDSSAIKSDMTQEDRTLSVIIKKERGPLECLLGPAIVFEIENLFDFRGGPVLRHRLAHGLISASECYDTDSIYACWFIFRLYCLPLFPHWEELTKRLDQL